MPRASLSRIEDVIEQASAEVVARVLKRIKRAIDQAVAAGIRTEVAKARREPRASVGRRRRGGEMTRWVADRRARRVPNFVIEMTGLKTKTQIVARYGVDAAFAKGKPPPPAKAGGIAASNTKVARVVRARPPIIRKKAAKKVA